MAGADRSVIVRLQADTSRYNSQMDAAAGSTGRVADGAERAGESTSRMGGAAAKAAGAIGAAFAGLAIADFLKESIDAASDLNETVSKAGTIFGDSFGQIEDWSKTAADSMGLSQAAALEAAASFGNMFLQLGIGEKQAAEMSTTVVQMAADFGSFNNLPTADVVDKISGAFRGEYDSLQAIIPNINAARVEQEAMTATGKTSADQLTASEKAMAVLAITTKDGALQLGDYARTSDGVANTQKTLQASMEDTQAAIGQALLPVVKSLLDLFQTVGVPILEGFGTALGFLVETITGIPGPVLAAVGAFAGMLVVGQVVGFMRGLMFVLPVIISGMGGLAGAATLAGRAMSAMGGPVVVGLGLAAAALAYFVSGTEDTAIAIGDLSGAVDENTGALKANAKEIVAKDTAGAAAKYVELGGAVGDFTAALLGAPGAQERFNAVIRDASIALLEAEGVYNGVASAQNTAGDTAQSFYDKMMLSGISIGSLGGEYTKIGAVQDAFNKGTGQIAEAQAGAATAIAETAAATDTSAEAMAKAEEATRLAAEAEAAKLTPTQSLKKATEELGAAAAYADTMTQFLTASLDAAAGNAVSHEQTTRLAAAAMREIGDAARGYAAAQDGVTEAAIKVRDAQAKVDEVTQNLGKSQEEGGTTADDLTTAQLALADANRANEAASGAVADATDRQFDANVKAGDSAVALAVDAFNLAGGNANLQAATAAATTSVEASRAAFIAAQPAAERTTQKTIDLANALFGIPGAVATKISESGADGVIGTADDVKGAVDAIPNSKNTDLTVTGGALSELQRIRAEINAIPNSNVKSVTIEQNTLVYTTPSGAKFSFMGGRVATTMGMASGGRIPGTPPADPRRDNILATVGGRPLAVRSREWIVNEGASDYYGDSIMGAINAKAIPKSSMFADGGSPSGFITSSGSSGAINMTLTLNGDGPITEAALREAQVVVAGAMRNLSVTVNRAGGQSL